MAKPKRRKVRCSYCGKYHRLRPAFVGYEDQALCVKCEKAIAHKEP